MLCGAVGALPMTGVIVRSSANVQAGAKTRMSTIMHGTWLLGTVALVPHLLERIPTSALAAILVLTGWKLVNPEHIKRLRSYGPFPVVIYAATVIGIVGFDLLTGVILGIVLTIAKMLWRSSRIRAKLVPHHSGRTDLYLEGSATFLRLPYLADTLDKVEPNAVLHVHLEKLYYIDHSCLDLIKEWSHAHTLNGGSVVMDMDRLAERFIGKEAA